MFENDPVCSGVPNFARVDFYPSPGVFRGGQPTDEGWQQLYDLGVRNIIKLNEESEGSDAAGIKLGMTYQYHPISLARMLTIGPDPVDFGQALDEGWPGTFVHCQHGQDRTGLYVAMRRLRQGQTHGRAWLEMKHFGFHEELLGLLAYFELARADRPEA